MGRPGGGGGGGSHHSSSGSGRSIGSGGHSSHSIGNSRPSSSGRSSSFNSSKSSSSGSSWNTSSSRRSQNTRFTPPPPRHTNNRSTVNVHIGDTNIGNRVSTSGARGSSSYGSSGSYGGSTRMGMGGIPYTPPQPVNYASMIIKGMVTIIVVIVLVSFLGMFSGDRSTINREKLVTGNAFDNNCVVDNLGWLNKSKLAKSLNSDFFSKTGIQPYIVLMGWRQEFEDGNARYNYAEEYFKNNIGRNDALLYMYFEPYDPDTDYGNAEIVWGSLVSSIMDAEAQDLFWGIHDNEFINGSSDDTVMYSTVFRKTANKIMSVSTTPADVLKTTVILAIVVAVIGGVLLVMNKKRLAEAERVAETERILNAGKDQSMMSSSDSMSDPLVDRYKD